MARQFKFAALFALSALATFASAQFSDLPECGVTCATGAASGHSCGTCVPVLYKPTKSRLLTNLA